MWKILFLLAFSAFAFKSLKAQNFLCFLIVIFSSLLLNGQNNETIITNVNIVSMKDGKILQGNSIMIKGNTIDQIVPNGRLVISENVKVIDAKNGFIIPGFIDMHVHVEHSSE
jgi:imidazolonepropionase-like amidohydrolase